MCIPVFLRQDVVSEQYFLLVLFMLPALAFAQGSHIEYICFYVYELSHVVLVFVLVQHKYVGI
jgi:hypothetical protein